MSDFDNLPPSKPTKRRAAPVVFGVGWRAFVHCPTLPGGEIPRTVPTLDSDGAAADNTLPEGTEVQIVGWRPKSRTGALYQVRLLSDGTEWWILGIHLRHRKERNALAVTTEERAR